MKNRISLISLLLACLFLTACQTTYTPSGFNPSQHALQTPRRAKFLEKTWAAQGAFNQPLEERYDSIYVAPVEIGYVKRNHNLWEAFALRPRTAYERDVVRLASYMQYALIRDIQRYPGNRFAIVSNPGPRTLIIELALVRLNPAKAPINSIFNAADFAAPGVGLLTFLGSGNIAIEGRLRDGANGKIIAMFEDRRSDIFSIGDVRSYTWYSGAIKNIDDWTRQGSDFLHAPPWKVVRRRLPITLIPW